MTRPVVLTDREVAHFPLPRALEAIRAALLTHASGELEAPSRLHGAQLTFTVGGTPEVLGFRAYHTLDAPHDDQLVAVWDAHSGRLTGIVVGSALGPLRTACLGAVGTDLLACPDASRLGLIGSGVQARAHALCVNTVRPLSQVLVYSRDAQRREQLAEELRAHGLPAQAAHSAEEVARASDLLTLATNSGVPVIETVWIQPGTHVCTLGPKVQERHEFPADLGSRASLCVTDSPMQLAGYPGGHLLAGSLVQSLGELLKNGPPPRRPDDVTLFLSVGLAGSEVLLAREILTASA